MICCFTSNSSNVALDLQSRMDSPQSRLTTITEITEIEKLSEDLCESISKNVSFPGSGDNLKMTSDISSQHLPSSSPSFSRMSNEEMDGLFSKMALLLGMRESASPPSTDNGMLDSNRSIEEILREAEELVSESLVRLERPTASSRPHQVQGQGQVQGPPEPPPNNKAAVQNSVKFSDVTETIPPQETRGAARMDARSRSDPDLAFARDAPVHRVRPQSTPASAQSNRRPNTPAAREESNIVEHEELKLSDLSSVSSTKPVDRLNPPVDRTPEEEGTDPCQAVTNVMDRRHFLSDKPTFLDLRKTDCPELIEEVADIMSDCKRLALVEEELQSQVELISSYQRENQRLSADIATFKERWKETEGKLLDKVREAEQTRAASITKASHEVSNLKGKLRHAEGSIADLQLQLSAIKEEKTSIEKLNEELTCEVMRLNCEVTEYKKEMESWKETEKERLVALESNAAVQAKLSQANTEVTRKQTEIVRLNGLIGQLRGELEKIRLGSIMNQTSENLTGTISQLQAALAIERDNCKDLVKEKDSMAKEMLDLRRQVKEMENIMIKRSKSGSGIQLGNLSNSESAELRDLEGRNKALLSELNQAQEFLKSKQEFLADLEKKYEEEVRKLKQELERTKTCDREHVAKASAVKEDAHLLATIRGLKGEISSRDKDIIKLNRELDDVRRTNKRLQREREKALNAGKYRGVPPPTKETAAVEKPAPDKSEPPQGQTKEYDAAIYEEQETINQLSSENKTLKEEVRKLEQDLISLHNKRIQDLSDLQEEHESELGRLMREHVAKHSSSAVANLQGQLYTQQMVIHHLKEQIKVLEERASEVTLLKAERDHLENSLIEANKKISRLHQLQSPTSAQYDELLEKLDLLERRHEMREEKLQSIVRDLLTKQRQGGGVAASCGPDCRDKLINKNREICYYRAEMDKILATLTEFRWNM